MENSFQTIAARYAGMHFPVFDVNESGERYAVKHIYDGGMERFTVITYRSDNSLSIYDYYSNGKIESTIKN